MTAASSRTRPADGTKGWVIGHAAGAPVILAPSWLVAAVVLTMLFAPTVRSIAPEIGDTTTYVVALSFVVLLFVSVFLHELAHGFTARACGLQVREFAITLWGGHTAFGGAASRPGASALIAVVGPLTNLVVAGACWLGALAAPDGGLLGVIAYLSAVANAFVAAFNLIPGLPLDGGRVLEALVWRVSGDRIRGSIVAGWAGRVVAVVFAVWAVGLPLLRGEDPDLFTIGWAALIGAFLWSGATGAIRGAQSERTIGALTVAAIARPAVAVPLSASVAFAESALVSAGAAEVVLTGPDGRPVAYVDAAAAAAVPGPSRAVTAVHAVAVPLPPGALVDGRLVGAELVRAVGQGARTSPALAVLLDGQVTGLIFATDVVAALNPRA
ncbi:site-2 protease family protein [Pengzhenrongella sicca]|uniref:Zinc metalloprotease n=1 Tax=Pengzhenrongella sicca TaxID=2819238 RepID=A0A8A4ZIE4_9MICO|nr:site-2 protease family protein [Pengzhenrongella sicca]QTE30773.1 site-2 protease family protein [Pengzhenrongella sicca]